MTQTQELKHRAQAKRKELEARLHEMQADAHSAKSDAMETIKRKLDDLQDAAREGWDNLSEATAKRVNDALK